jgi:carboxyl-terminal processing protease
MKSFFRMVLIISFLSQTLVFAQSLTDKYFYTCKIWGFLKYYHSNVAKGVINWDSVLIKTLPKIKSTSTIEEFNKKLSEMIDTAGVGQYSAIPLPVVPPELRYNLQLDWINDSLLSSEVKMKLLNLKDAFRPQSNYYVNKVLPGIPSFTTDIGFNALTWNNITEEIRLAILFRYWNMVNYFYPYKNLLDRNWDDILKEFIPKLINATDQITFHRRILELTADLNDAHAVTSSTIISGNIRGYYFLPLELKYIEGKTVISRIGKGVTNIKPGDIINKINNVNIEIIRDSLKKILPGSNPASLERNVNNWVRNSLVRSQSNILEIENEKGISNKTLTNYNSGEYLALFEIDSTRWYKINANHHVFGYVNMGLLVVDDLPKMFHELWGTDAIIFDVRNYPNGVLWDMMKYFYPNPIHIASFTTPDLTYPGTFYWQEEIIGEVSSIPLFSKPIYLLFNEQTQSHAEYTIMSLEQYPKSVKIGSQTAGADGNVVLINLPDGISTYFTGLGTFYPDHSPTQRIGIKPDIEVSPTINGIRNGIDEVLNAAFKHYADSIKTVIPANVNLKQNYPNPFNNSTIINFQIPTADHVTFKVFDILGREVATLVDETLKAGSYSVNFEAKNISSAVYFYQLNTGNSHLVKNMAFIK